MLLACERPADRGGECLLIDGQMVHADLSTRWHEATVMLSRPHTAFFGYGLRLLTLLATTWEAVAWGEGSKTWFEI